MQVPAGYTIRKLPHGFYYWRKEGWLFRISSLDRERDYPEKGFLRNARKRSLTYLPLWEALTMSNRLKTWPLSFSPFWQLERAERSCRFMG
jgi:hypothetical protein